MTTVRSIPARSVEDDAGVPVAPSDALSRATAATGAVLAANGLLLGLPLFLSARPYSELATGGLHLAHYVTWTVCLLVLTQLYPLMRSLRGPSGAALPEAVVILAGVGAALDACARFVSAFVTPYLGAHDPALLDSTPDAILLAPLLTAGVVAMVGTATLGLVAWRRRIFPRGAAVLLVIGALAIPALGPVSNVLVGAALVWIGISVRGRR